MNKQKNNGRYGKRIKWVGFLIAIALAIIVVLVFYKEFTSKNEIKIYKIPISNDSYIYLYNDPEDLNIPCNVSNLSYKLFEKEKVVYFVFDPNLTGNFSKGIIQLESEVLVPLKMRGVKVMYACLYNTTDCYKKKLKVLRCEAVKEGICIEYVNGILGIFNLSRGWIRISGDQNNILKATDYFILRFYELL